jgi:peptidoglycan/LPS O-acetylase OafA/YrhL
MHHFAITWDEYRRLFGTAPVAVDFFFCLSGFVIAHAYHRRLAEGMTLREYMVRRLVRLYPMYALGGILGLAAVVALKEAHLTDLTWGGIAWAGLLHLLYIPNNSPVTETLFAARMQDTLFPLNNPAWSLFFELLCANFAYAFVARFGRRVAVGITAFFGVGLVIAASRYGAMPGWGTDNFLGGVPRVMYAFFAGVVIFHYRAVLRRLPRLPAWIVVLSVIVLFGLPRTTSTGSYWLATALFGVPLLVVGGTLAEQRLGPRAIALATYGGRVSYPVYCIHYPLLMLEAASGWRPQNFAFAVALFVLVAVAVSHVLMVWLDEPIRRWLTRRRGPARPTAAIHP